ncbi:porphyromonas-type peptidyl-arginine deiminase [Streptomyces avidinii]
MPEMSEMNENAVRTLDRRGFLTAAGLTAAGLTAAGAALASVGGQAFAAVRPPAAAGGFAVPIDTVRHTRTWMAWPDSSAIWGRKLAGVQANIALIAKTIAKYEPVVMCANSASVAKAKSACGSAVTVIGTIPVDDCWMRDSGPVFRTNGAGGLDAVGLNFNGWGNQQTHAKDSLVAGRVAAYAGVPFSTAGFIGEGGAVETDGAGTLMATRSSLINPDRNPGVSQAQLEAAMCAAFGASKVVWFKGVLGRDITDDHVDATSRFLAEGSGLVQMPLPKDTDAWSNDARQQFQILSATTNAQGHPVVVTKLQGPDYDKIRSTSAEFVGAYANYYVVNGAVIAPQFGDTSADAAAKTTLQRAFPGRVIEQLNIDNLGAGGGGIHCVTQQQPVA